MNHGISHLIWMVGGFIFLLLLGKIVGVSLVLLFPLFCFFMMVAMMMGMGHGSGDNRHDNKG
jgi:hypothetical protein